MNWNVCNNYNWRVNNQCFFSKRPIPDLKWKYRNYYTIYLKIKFRKCSQNQSSQSLSASTNTLLSTKIHIYTSTHTLAFACAPTQLFIVFHEIQDKPSHTYRRCRPPYRRTHLQKKSICTLWTETTKKGGGPGCASAQTRTPPVARIREVKPSRISLPPTSNG